MKEKLSKWLPVFSKLEVDPICLVDELYSQDKPLCPKKADVFKAFELVSPSQIKVVIVGQDPYHTPHQAQGLAFSLPDGGKMQPSMRNILLELETDLGTPRASQDLTYWAEQGVLLLNTALTVVEGCPGSMADEWKLFAEGLMRKLVLLPQPIVFVLWGKHAQQFEEILSQKENGLVLTSSHPSPFSARKGFLGSKPFSKVNAFLNARDIEEIDWNR